MIYGANTLVSLVIAIVAILSEKNRKHLLLKFHIVDYLLFVICFVLINYFVYYESFYVKGVYLSQFYFNKFGLHNPKHYAYIISILCLLYFFYKIWYAFYPFSKIESVTKFYEQLIENNEITILLDLIDRYHKTDIIKAIIKTVDYNPQDKSWEDDFKVVTFKENAKEFYKKVIQFLFPFSWYNRHSYSESVLHNILNSPAFIILASNQRPYLLAEIFSYFSKKKQNGFPQDLVNTFLTELIQHKNFWLRKELQQSEKYDFGLSKRFHNDNKILSALLLNLSVADINQVWRSFGDTAIEEIEEERTKGYESKMFQEFRETQFLWEYKTYFAIQFFKIIFNEAIIKKYDNSHFWIYYYRSITDAILKTFIKYPIDDYEEGQTVYHNFIDTMINNCFLWLRVSNNYEDKSLYKHAVSCLGKLLFAVCNSPFYKSNKKVIYIQRLFSFYCNLTSNSESEKMRETIGNILVKPSNLLEEGNVYYTYIEIAWNTFDKIPYSDEENELYYFKQFKQQVIIPLGLNPDIF